MYHTGFFFHSALINSNQYNYLLIYPVLQSQFCSPGYFYNLSIFFHKNSIIQSLFCVGVHSPTELNYIIDF